jgi:hypothetical protein
LYRIAFERFWAVEERTFFNAEIILVVGIGRENYLKEWSAAEKRCSASIDT